MTLILEQTPSRYKNKIGDMKNLNLNAIKIVKDERAKLAWKVYQVFSAPLNSRSVSHWKLTLVMQDKQTAWADDYEDVEPTGRGKRGSEVQKGTYQACDLS